MNEWTNRSIDRSTLEYVALGVYESGLAFHSAFVCVSVNACALFLWIGNGSSDSDSNSDRDINRSQMGTDSKEVSDTAYNIQHADNNTVVFGGETFIETTID